MNLENFAEYLKYPSRLYQLPYEELKSLTMQYPYCGNFHLLLLIKSKLEGHPDLEKNLAKAATYSVDRKFLRRLMLEEQLLPVESQLSFGEDEVLELKDLFTLETELEKIAVEPAEHTPSGEQHRSVSFDLFPEENGKNGQDDGFEIPGILLNTGENPETDTPGSPPAESYSEEPLVPDQPGLEPIVPEDVIDQAEVGVPDAAFELVEFSLDDDLALTVSTIAGIAQRWEAPAPPVSPPVVELLPAFEVPDLVIQDCVAAGIAGDNWWEVQANTATVEWDVPKSTTSPKTPPRAIAPTPKSKFKSYKSTYRRPLARNSEKKAFTPSLPRELPRNPRMVAEESIREDLGVASETLAGLLVDQHQYDRAIKMYEHLSLLIPEKNTYFAAKIDAIKKL